MIELNQEQRRAYDRFIRARDAVKLVKTSQNIKNEWVPLRDYVNSVREDTQATPLFELNDLWFEYKEASKAWWAIEPAFRDVERMRMSRGDYETSDNWDEPTTKVKSVYEMLKESQ